MKRIIFTLLYCDGNFMLSRNFRLQKVGDINWLFSNYDFAKVSHGLDELIVIDISRAKHDSEKFCDVLKAISKKCFIPLTAGGGILDFETASNYLRSGADKLLMGSAFHSNPNLCYEIARYYGRQCLVGIIDYEKNSQGIRRVLINKGSLSIANSLTECILHMDKVGVGEIILQAIDKDGTAMGLDVDVYNDLPSKLDIPLILMGGIGKREHIQEGLAIPSIDAVSTANLFNFIGSTFLKVRDSFKGSSTQLASWVEKDYEKYQNIFNLEQLT